MNRWILIVLLIGSHVYADEELSAYNVESVRPDLMTEDPPNFVDQDIARNREEQKEVDEYQAQLEEQEKEQEMQNEIDAMKERQDNCIKDINAGIPCR